MNNECVKLTTIAIIENNGKRWVGTNWCENPQKECPRKDLPTGVGYDLCKNVCKQKYHAEVDACLKAGENARGGTLYLIGHTYCCDNCKRVMGEHGIKKTVILDLTGDTPPKHENIYKIISSVNEITEEDILAEVKYTTPGTGIYKVDKPKDYKEDEFRFVFNPGGTVYKGWEYHERKKGYGIRIERSDDNIFNYDMLNLDDIEFYLNCRSERHDYLDMMPLLRKIRKDRIKEIKWEQEFVRLVMERTGATKKMVLKALTWWKYKNIWKRPVKEDDSKALRMIESRVKKIMLKT